MLQLGNYVRIKNETSAYAKRTGRVVWLARNVWSDGDHPFRYVEVEFSNRTSKVFKAGEVELISALDVLAEL